MQKLFWYTLVGLVFLAAACSDGGEWSTTQPATLVATLTPAPAVTFAPAPTLTPPCPTPVAGAATIDPNTEFVCPGEPCIKGNINKDAECIYHVPGCDYYAVTTITPPDERMFSSEAEALAAGWRKAKNCP